MFVFMEPYEQGNQKKAEQVIMYFARITRQNKMSAFLSALLSLLYNTTCSKMYPIAAVSEDKINFQKTSARDTKCYD